MSRDTESNERPPIHEVKFSIHNASYPFVGISETADCTIELAEMVPRGDGRYAEFFNVTGTDPDQILDLKDEPESVDLSLLREHENGGLFEFRVSTDCPAVRLAELGALPRDIRGEEGRGRIVVEIPPQYDPRAVVGAFLEEYPTAELRAKRKKQSATPLFTDGASRNVLRGNLTDRQCEVLQIAYDAGYYEWPRDTTGSEIAEELGISSATFSEHIHTAERKILTILFEEYR